MPRKKQTTKKKTEQKKYKLYKHPKFGMVYGEAVKLPPARVAWPYLVEPKEGGTNEDGQIFNDRYELVAIYPKKDKEFKAVCKTISDMAEAMMELFNKGKKTKVSGFEIGVDGNDFDHEKYPYYKDATVITLRNSSQPMTVGTKCDKDGKPLKIDPETITGGCICALVVTPLFTASGGLTFKVNVVQLVEDDGTRFGGGINPSVYSSMLEYETAEDDDEEEEEEDDDEEEEEDEDDDDSDDDDEEDEEEEDEEDEEEDDDEDDEDGEDDEEEEEEKPKRGRKPAKGKPAARKKAIDVL